MQMLHRTFQARARKGFRALLAFAACFVSVAGASAETPKPAAKIDFNRDIRGILTENCFKCHGPDDKERKARLRLDVRTDALKPAKSGERAIVPDAPDKSELVRRITASDPDEQMPPVKSGRKLTAPQIDLLRRWISQGAPYATHWSYVKPVRPALPVVKNQRWARNPVDQFILARLEREGLQPSPEADRYTLARRASLDLTGLPPTIEEVDRFVKDRNPHAYEDMVDRLLAKPSYSEHWARMWLDLARYADSAGYADDTARTIWAFRDYVIKSFNANKPFDRFTIEQIAGDLLPDADDDDVLATAFHRNTMTNNEGGTDDEEFRNAAVIDRVNTTMAVWMGTSMGCAQCHNHKYDPISQKDYFSFFAILNNTEDADRSDEAPVAKYFTEAEKAQRTKLESEVGSLTNKLQTSTPELTASQTKWEQSFPVHPQWLPLQPAVLKSINGTTLSARADGVVLAAAGQKTDVYTLELPLETGPIAGLRLEASPDASLPNHGPGHATNGAFVVSRFTATMFPPQKTRTTGRFVRVELPGKERTLSLAEVQVLNGSENIALRGAATQSSTAYDSPARLAIDGNTDGHLEKAKSTTHTDASENPWWELDLKQSQPIDRIAVWNRTDEGLQSRLSGFRLVVLNEAREPVWEKTFKDAPNPSMESSLDGSFTVQFATASADVTQSGFDAASVLADKADPKKGWSASPGDGKPHQLFLLPAKPLQVAPGSKLVVTLEQISEQESNTLGCFRISASRDDRLAEFVHTPPAIVDILGLDSGKRDSEQRAKLTGYYLASVAPELKSERDRLAEVTKELADVKGTTVPIMREVAGDKRRKTHIQLRGNFKNLGDEVAEALPAAFRLPSESGTPNRLTLARWLVDENNPLTARVMANRFWEQIFGLGIVRTSEDFGSQGDRPTHPELLDWLATEFIRQKWDMKAFLKTLVMSATYRQSSRVTPELQERDPDNILLARGPRVRLPAEVVRDQALAVSGLLSHKMLGPSVRPPQPSSGLSAAFGSSLDWKTSEGEDRYRRALYVEWRRTRPYPSMATFDAPNREVCIIRRPRSNTPLQALVTLNDPVYVEAARALAKRMIQAGGSKDDKVRFGFRLCLARPPHDGELRELVQFYEEARANYAKDPMKAAKIADEPEGSASAPGKVADLAAWTTVGNVLLNLDEVLMRR